MDGFRRMLWVGRQHSADHIPVSALQLVTRRRFRAASAKSKEQKPLFSSPPPNPAFEGSRGYAVACFLGVRPPAPLNSGVGRVEERAKARRAAGSTALFDRGCAGRESIRLHHVIFWALVVVRGVSVCSSPPVFQPGVVQAVRPPSPRSTLHGFQAGPPAFVFGSVGGRSIVPARSPTRRSRGRGVTLWPVFP